MTAQFPIYQQNFMALGPIVMIVLVFWLAAYPVYRWKIKDLQAFLYFWLGSLAACLWWIYHLIQAGRQLGNYRISPLESIASGGATRDIAILASAIFFLLAGLCIYLLYQKWSGQSLTEKEQAKGMQGVVAWLSLLRVVLAIVIVAAANLAGLLTISMAIVLTAGALLAYPFWINFLREEGSSEGKAQDTLTGERERVLRMLEEGKITAEDSVELLNALGTPVSAKRTVSLRTLNASQRLILIGTLLVIISFFFPWFRVRSEPGQVPLSTTLNMLKIADPGMVAKSLLSDPSLQNISMDIFGTDLKRGMGEIVLILAILVALLPYISFSVPPFLSKAALLIGSCILLILLLQIFRYVSVGFVMVILGYVLAWIGTLKQQGFDISGDCQPA